MRTPLYIAACLIVPALWGLAASWVLDRIQSRKSKTSSRPDDGADMYHI